MGVHTVEEHCYPPKKTFPPQELCGSLGKILRKRFNDFTLIGRSWAADGTAFVIPELDIALDAGLIVYGKRSQYVLLTHVHTDHSHMLTHMRSRSKPPLILLPRQSVQVASKYLDAAQQMTSHLTDDEYACFPWEPAFKLQGVEVGERVKLVPPTFVNSAVEETSKKLGKEKDKRKSGSASTDLFVDIIHCDHTVPCVGYRVIRMREKLKAEYIQLPGKELGALRKQGVKICETVEVPLFTFMGDTHVTALLKKNDGETPCHTSEGDTSTTQNQQEQKAEVPLALQAPIVIIECTFLSHDDTTKALKTKHVVWPELRPIVQANPEVQFVLIHFSRRWTVQMIREFFSGDEIPKNVIPWIEPAPIPSPVVVVGENINEDEETLVEKNVQEV